MTKFQKIVLGLVAGITVVLLFLAISPASSKVGGVYNQVTKYFYDGINVGTNSQFTVSNAGVVALSGAATSSSSIKSSSASAGIGYATGSGCAVVQITSRATGVTCTGVSGAITTDTTSLAAGAEAEFTVTDTSVAVGDAVIVSLRSGATASTSIALVSAVAAGSFKITLTNLNASTADTGAAIINFAVIKAVSA